MELAVYNQAKSLIDAINKANVIKNNLSSLLYNIEKGKGIDIEMVLKCLNAEDSKYFSELVIPFILSLSSSDGEQSTDVDLMRHFIGAAERAVEYFENKFKEL